MASEKQKGVSKRHMPVAMADGVYTRGAHWHHHRIDATRLPRKTAVQQNLQYSSYCIFTVSCWIYFSRSR